MMMVARKMTKTMTKKKTRMRMKMTMMMMTYMVILTPLEAIKVSTSGCTELKHILLGLGLQKKASD